MYPISEYINSDYLIFENFIKIALIFLFLLLFVVALWEISYSYHCDSYTCMPFDKAGGYGSENFDFQLFIEKFHEDSIWCLAYISATAAAIIALVLFPVNKSVYNFILIFLIIFLACFFALSYTIFHYVRPIKVFMKDYIEQNYVLKKDINNPQNNNTDNPSPPNKSENPIFPNKSNK